jgi:hypothetical protein
MNEAELNAGLPATLLGVVELGYVGQLVEIDTTIINS